MKAVVVILCTLSALSTFGGPINFSGGENVSKGEAKAAIKDLVENTTMSKEMMSKVIDQLIASGQISKTDGDATKVMLKNMSKKDLAALKKTMVNMMSAKINQMKFPKSKL
ncbi:MAG: hypothetical protein KAG61_10910 [Bacteriovoracaceae bacterium]|nr:hypothetical protein [Bacteriovoracaceae bacterium]